MIVSDIGHRTAGRAVTAQRGAQSTLNDWRTGAAPDSAAGSTRSGRWGQGVSEGAWEADGWASLMAVLAFGAELTAGQTAVDAEESPGGQIDADRTRPKIKKIGSIRKVKRD